MDFRSDSRFGHVCALSRHRRFRGRHVAQIGIIVCIGVLLDTLLVRTVIVPSLAFIAGEKFWWPGRAISVGAEVRTPQHTADSHSAKHSVDH